MTDKQRLVKGLIEKFTSKGLEISSANCEGYKRPKPIKNFAPDVIAWDPYKETYYFASAIIPSELDSKEEETKLAELSSLVMNIGYSQEKMVPLYLGIPKNETNRVVTNLDKSGIPRNNIFTLEIL